jgi:hypothetical protein
LIDDKANENNWIKDASTIGSTIASGKLNIGLGTMNSDAFS